MASGADPDSGFTLVCGGPLYRLLVKLHLVKSPVGWVPRRIAMFVAVTWLPLLALAFHEGRALHGGVLPFLHDASMYSKFLVAVPILIVAEVFLHRLIGAVVAQFTQRGIVDGAQVADFQRALASAEHLRDSWLVEALILAFALIVVPLTFHRGLVPVETWLVSVVDGRPRLTFAGWWLTHVSTPLFQFLILRLYYRLFLWGRFLWQVSRMPLHLAPSHPDRSGGLGFLEESIFAFAPVVFAQTVAASGLLARRAHVAGASVADFKVDAIILVVSLVIVVLLPLCMFAPKLLELRRSAKFGYGELATSYVRGFERKWLSGREPEEPLVGSADIQSLADMGGSYEIIETIRPVPFSLRAVGRLAVVTAIPFLPLVFTLYSLQEVVKRLMGVLL